MPIAAADPTSSPEVASPRPATCAERYPADGPAGVDLQLGCVVAEIVGAYSGAGSDASPPRISTWLVPLGMGVLVLVAVGIVLRVVRRRAGQRLAPASPTTWWSCPSCRSLNPAGMAACYRCGASWDPSAFEVRADAERPAAQSFGERRDRP